MFLNAIGQPIILDSQKTYGPYEQYNGPMLLTSAAFQNHTVPANFCGGVIGSAEDVARFKTLEGHSNHNYAYSVIKPHEPTKIENDVKNMLVTLIPAGKTNGESSHLYYLQNNYVRVLIVDQLTGYLDFIPKASAAFHRALNRGIDVMYIDDQCFESLRAEALEQREHLYALVQLIRPKFLYGLRKDNVPKSLLDLCATKTTSTLPTTVNNDT